MAEQFFSDCCCGSCQLYVRNPGKVTIKSATATLYGFEPFIIADEFVRGGDYSPLLANFVFTYANVNSAALLAFAAGGTPTTINDVVISAVDVPAHPVFGNVQKIHWNNSAWRNNPRPVRCSGFTAVESFAFAANDVVRVRGAQGEGQFFRRTSNPRANGATSLDITSSPNPSSAPFWWAVTTNPGDSVTRATFFSAPFNDLPDWATFGDFKFELGTDLNQGFMRVAREGQITAVNALSEDAAHLAIVSGGFVSGGTVFRAINPALVTLARAPYGGMIAFTRSGATDPNLPNWQTVAAVARGNTVLTTDSNPPDRYGVLEARTTIVSLWGYELALSSVQGSADSSNPMSWDYVERYSSDILTGNLAVTYQTSGQAPTNIADHPLKDPTTSLLGGAEIATVTADGNGGHYPYAGLINWAGTVVYDGGVAPKFAKPGDYITVVIKNAGVQEQRWRLYFTQATRWPAVSYGGVVPSAPNASALLYEDTIGMLSASPSAPTITFTVTDTRSMADAQRHIWPSWNANTRISFSSTPTRQKLAARINSMSWANLRVQIAQPDLDPTIGGATDVTIAQNPDVAVIHDVQLSSPRGRTELFAAVVDDGLAVADCGVWHPEPDLHIGSGDSIGVTPTNLDLAASPLTNFRTIGVDVNPSDWSVRATKVLRARLCVSQYWPWRMIKQTPDGVDACDGSPATPGRTGWIWERFDPRNPRVPLLTYMDRIPANITPCVQSQATNLPFQSKDFTFNAFAWVSFDRNQSCL